MKKLVFFLFFSALNVFAKYNIDEFPLKNGLQISADGTTWKTVLEKTDIAPATLAGDSGKYKNNKREKDEIDKMKYELKSLNKETYNINSTSKQLKEELNEEKKVTEELKKNINNCIEEKKNLTTETILIDNRIIKVKKQLEELMKYLKLILIL